MPQATPWAAVWPRNYEAPQPLLIDFGHVDGPRWAIVGTEYGFLHTTGGDVRTWRSRSDAARACRAYIAARK